MTARNARIFLSAGHSNKDPGAVTTALDPKGSTVKRREADIAVEMRNMVSFYLSQARVAHDVDGRGTDNIPLSGAIRKARNYEYALEFHCNSVDSKRATGTEVLCDFNDLKDRKLATDVSAAIAKALGVHDRGAKPENSGQHTRLGFVGAGGVIVELFFLSNPSDLAKWDARKWLAAKACAGVLIDL